MEFNKRQVKESQLSREKKKTLKTLKDAFLTKKNPTEEIKAKQKNSLQALMSSIKVNRLKDTFYRKLSVNNIFQSPTKLQLLSQKEKNIKRLIKIKGLHVPTKFLAILYVLQMIFMIITFYIASCMAFLDDFVEREVYHTNLVRGLNAVTVVICFSKIVITSAAQSIKRGILLTYITDIFIDYAKSFILFVDMVYMIINIVLFVIKSSAVHLIQEWSLVLFVCSIIRITVSSSNLTLFRTTFINSPKKDQYYKLFQVIFFNFIFAHFVASMLFAMSKIDKHENWMIAKHIDHEVWYIQYMWGYYWATTTMMTVGFGDFLPVTYCEGFIVAFLEFFSCIVLAYNISEIGGIISTIRSSQNQYIAKIAVFKRMAQQNEIDFELKTKIQGYLREQKAIKQKFEFNQQNELLESLPSPLRKEFIMASNGKIFRYLPFFKNLQKQTILALSEALASKVFYPSEILEKANQYNENIIILKEGKVGLAYRKSDSSLNGIIVEDIQIVQRQFMTYDGLIETKILPILLTSNFLTPGKVVNYDITAISYSYVFQLAKTRFLSAIKQSEIDTEYFFSLIHQYSSSNEWQQLPCNDCMKDYKQDKMPTKKIQNKLNGNNNFSDHIYYHTKFQCPKLHYLPLRGVIIMKYLASRGFFQMRKPKFYRNMAKMQNCLLLRKGPFKFYEKNTFIIEKRDVEKIVGKSVSNKSKYSKNLNRRISLFDKKPKRKNTEVIQNIKPKNYVSEQDYTLNKRKTIPSRSNKLEDYQFEDILSNDAVSEQEDKQLTIMESIVKYTIKQINQQNVNLSFWDLQIDQMADFFNYFPEHNAAKLDNFELCKNKQNKVKDLHLITEIIMFKNQNSENLPSKYNKQDQSKKSDTMSAFMNISTSKINMSNLSAHNASLLRKDIQYNKVQENQESDVIKEEKQKYLDRNSKFAYQFLRERMTDKYFREDERPNLKSVKKVRFSYNSIQQNVQELSNEANKKMNQIPPQIQGPQKILKDSISNDFNNSKGLYRTYL